MFISLQLFHVVWSKATPPTDIRSNQTIWTETCNRSHINYWPNYRVIAVSDTVVSTKSLCRWNISSSKHCVGQIFCRPIGLYNQKTSNRFNNLQCLMNIFIWIKMDRHRSLKTYLDSVLKPDLHWWSFVA